MEVKIQLYSLSLLLLLVSCTVDGGDNSLIYDDLGGIQYKTDDYEVTENYQNKHQNYNACTYKNRKDPNIRKNIEEIIKVLVKDYLQPAMETPTEQDHDVARDIQDAANKIIIQLALHASNITRKILQSMEKPNDSQAVIDTEIQRALIENQNQIKKKAELEDKISLLSNKTVELTDTINVTNNRQSESMACLNNKIATLENLTDTIINVNNNQQSESMASMNNKIATLENLTDTINVNNNQQSESMASMNNKIATLENLTNSDIHDIRDMIATIEKNQKSLMNHSELQTNQKEEYIAKVTSLCHFKLPASIIPNPNIWKKRQFPEQDNLDKYMIKKTGCSYLALEYNEDHELAAAAFPGQLEWRVALRTRERALMRLKWASANKYSFRVGYNGKSQLYDHVHRQFPRRATPGLLAEDRYVPLYIIIKDGKLTAGAVCEHKPWFTADFAAEKGQQIERRVWTYSYYGAKFLYDCPASFTGQ